MATKRFKRVTSTAPPKPNGNVSKRVSPRAEPDYDDDERPTLGGGVAPDQELGSEEIRAGWGASQETIDSTSQYAQTFKPETKVQIIKILEAKPYASFRRHWIDRVGVGKRPYVCFQSIGKDCPLCDVGDKPGAVTAFNMALCSDDGQATLKAWECGVKLTGTLKGFNIDPKIGPLDKRNLYFAVSKTEASQRQQVTTNVFPVRERDLLEDYGTPPLDDEQMEKLLAKCYTADIITMSTRRELEEVAAEMTGEEAPAGKSWGS